MEPERKELVVPERHVTKEGITNQKKIQVTKPNQNYLTFTTRLYSLLKQDLVYDQLPYRC